MNARQLLAAAALVVLAAGAPAAQATPAAGSQPPANDGLPRAITAAAPVTAVYCAGPCCCGQIATLYHGHWYSRPLGYCRWFRPLREGQVVTTTLTLVR